MSGYIGGILILSGCFMYGLSYSQRLKNRITILKDMVRMLSVMNNHIGYSLIDMTQIFERLGDFDMCSYVRDFTGYIYEALNKSDIDTFALIWNEAADKAFAGILGKRQLEIIKEAGSISTFIRGRLRWNAHLTAAASQAYHNPSEHRADWKRSSQAIDWHN